MTMGEMNKTQQLDELGQKLRLDNIPEGLGSSQASGLYIGDLAVTALTAAKQVNWQGESL